MLEPLTNWLVPVFALLNADCANVVAVFAVVRARVSVPAPPPVLA
jgi:hypothetical protein